MGAFFTNYQVRSDSSDDVRNSIAKLTKSSAFVSPPASGWVTVYEKASDDQDLDLLRRIAMGLSRALRTAVFAFLVHDSDVLQYLLYENGQLADEFNSAPDYFEKPDAKTVARLRGDPHALLPHCRPGVTFEDIAAVIHPRDGFAMAEEMLQELAGLLGIDAGRATCGFKYFDEEGPEVVPDADQFVSAGRKRTPRWRRAAASPAPASAPIGPATETGAAGPPVEPYPHAVHALIIGRTRPLAWRMMSGRGGATAAKAEQGWKKVQGAMDREAAKTLRASQVEGRPAPEALVAAADAGPAALADLIAAATPQWLTEVAALCVGDLREWVPAMLDRGADPAAPLIHGGTLLTHAIGKNDVATVAELLRRGLDVNVRTAALPYTPLMYAAASGAVGVLELLLEAGADINAVATDGATALSLALRRGEGDPIVSILRPLVQDHG